MKTLDDFALKGKTILLRVDFNVPFQDGKLSDKTRITAALPSLNTICQKGGRVVLLSHFGRPKGQPVPAMSLAKIRAALEDIFARPVTFLPSLKIPALPEAGQVFLLENLRFHAGEEQNDTDFARQLARLGDIYINDAFSVSHRAHASVDALARLLPSGIGRNMQKELSALEAALGTPKRPLTAIIGGAKISTKIAVVENLIAKTDNLIIGGAMANNFLAAVGKPMGRSLFEPDYIQKARDIMARAEKSGCALHLPLDARVAKELKAGAHSTEIDSAQCPDDAMMLDIGQNTLAHLEEVLDKTKTLIWNGPLGAFETPPFDRGTTALAKSVAERVARNELTAIAGGGDTLAALNVAGVYEKLSYVSTAGGAFLEWMEGRKLPALIALEASTNARPSGEGT